MIKSTGGTRHMVGFNPKIDKSKLKVGTRVTLDLTTLTIMRVIVELTAEFGQGG